MTKRDSLSTTAHSGPIARKWRRLMRLQTQLLSPFEIPYFFLSSGWRQARSIVDLGVGNGDYLNEIVNRFPDKTYTGIDISPDHAAIAQRLFKSTNKDIIRPRVIIKTADALQITEKYDGILARLLAQHLPSTGMFIQQCGEILNPGGCLVIIESIDSERIFQPRVPIMEVFFDRLRQDRCAKGYNRDAGKVIAKIAQNHGFQPEILFTVVASSLVPFSKARFYRSYCTVAELVEDDFSLDFDYQALRTQLRRWYENPNSYTQLALSINIYKKSE